MTFLGRQLSDLFGHAQELIVSVHGTYMYALIHSSYSVSAIDKQCI